MAFDELVEDHYGYFLECFPQFEGIARLVADEIGLTKKQVAVAFMRFLRHIGGGDDDGGETIDEGVDIAQFFKRAA